MAKKKRIDLYGAIEASGDNSAANFIKRFNEAQGCEVIDLHIHSPGGDVFEGNLIHNTILQSKTPVDVYVDGISASMASIVMLAGRNIFMSENAFVMIHSPYTFAVGSAEDLEKSAELMRKMEDLFIAAYCKKTGKEKEVVAAWLKGDNWFTAQEALDEKLIDGIVSASDVNVIVSVDDMKKTTACAILKQFQAYAINNNPKNKNEMNKQRLIDKFGLQGVSVQSTDEQIEAAIEAKLKANETALEDVKKSQVSAAVTAAINAKKVTEKQRETYEMIGMTNGIEVLNKVLEGIQVSNSIVAQLGGNGNASTTHEGWDWDKFQKEDPRALEALQKSDPEKFNALHKAKYGN